MAKSKSKPQKYRLNGTSRIYTENGPTLSQYHGLDKSDEPVYQEWRQLLSPEGSQAWWPSDLLTEV